MALRLTLKAGERAIIGGAVVRNGDNRAELLVENSVPILRQSDILSPRAVRTPCDQIQLALQLAYVEPARATDHLQSLDILIEEVGLAAVSLTPLLDEIRQLTGTGKLYQAIKRAQVLRHREKVLIANVS